MIYILEDNRLNLLKIFVEFMNYIFKDFWSNLFEDLNQKKT